MAGPGEGEGQGPSGLGLGLGPGQGSGQGQGQEPRSGPGSGQGQGQEPRSGPGPGSGQGQRQEPRSGPGPGPHQGPYRATRLWAELTRQFRAGMPLRSHRQGLRRHGRCFSAAEAADWLHRALRSGIATATGPGPGPRGHDVSREQAVQLLRKFLKHHIIEDIKGRWGDENLEDNGALYRFPSASPVKPLPSPPRENSENLPTDKEKLFKLPHLSKRTLKKQEIFKSLENLGKTKPDVTKEDKEDTLQRKEISQEYVKETWRNIILIHLQSVLGLPSLEGLVEPAQLVPEHILYNMSCTSKHGVVVLHNKADLPHWVLSAMKCLAYWPRNNDMSQATYSGFERDVFRTVADYFLSLPEPLLTFEYYDLFVNVLVLCGFITIPALCSGKHSVQDEKCDPQPSKTLHLNSFKSTECLLLSLIHREPDRKKTDEGSKRFCLEEPTVQKQHPKKWQEYKLTHQQGSAAHLIGGSCQNLAGFSKEQDPPAAFRTRCYSLERIGAAPGSVCSEGGSHSLGGSGVNTLLGRGSHSVLCGHKASCELELGSASSSGTQPQGSRRALQGEQLLDGTQGSKQLRCPLSSLSKRNSRSCTAINRPVAEITVKPRAQLCGQGNPSPCGVAASVDSRTEGSEITIQRRLCRSSTELSECSLTPSPCVLAGTQKLLRPHRERVAVEALQLCCLLLPPPSRRRLQLLLRMLGRVCGNVDMPRLHQTLGTRTLLLQTFSRCVLRPAEGGELDELLSTRLLSFLMDHQQEIFQIPTHLQVAVQHHLQHVRVAQSECPEEEICAILPTYSYCKQITPQEFEEQKVSTSQAAMAELLENIIKDKNLSVKDKKKKLKQFQREYPQIYQRRFPRTGSEAALLDTKPTLRQPLLGLRRPRLHSLRD
ncbi:DEP domain-containing protein 1A isoform X2 [Pithys albifrons albifrons]|uniref:DEP domain-containing protein 1A isoform X2 n=1 Tax=Pithys albifrons albifrons TaxID=3385563 RepID=UPI003A5D1173